MKKYLLLLMCFVLFFQNCDEKKKSKKSVSGTVSERKSDYQGQKAVYHFNRNNLVKTAGGLKNIINHLNAVGDEKSTIVALFHGEAVHTLKAKPGHPGENKVVEAIHKRARVIKKRGVRIKVCQETLKEKKLDYKRELYDVRRDDLLTSGVAELSRLQMSGHRYIKP